MKNMRTILAALAASSLLAACGGGSGGGSEPQAANEVPASALSSPAAYTEFAATLTQSDTALPLGLGNVATPPTSESDAPLAI